jgi:hypothetical protein
MAEYYPLLAKAVAALPNSTPETRRAVYERARKALLGQLQNLQPPISPADLARETEALDAAVAKLEAEFAGKPVPGARGVPPRPISKSPTPPSRPAPPPRPPIPTAAPPSGPKENGRPAPSPPATNGPVTRSAEPPAPPPTPRPVDPKLPPREPLGEPPPEPRVRLSAPARPMAPQPDYDDAPVSRNLWIVIGVVVLIVAGVAIAAWKLRDRPDQLAAFNKPAEQTTTDKTGAKNTDRVGAPAPSSADEQTAPSSGPASSTVAPSAPAESTAAGAPTSAPITASPPVAAPATGAATPKPSDSNAQLPVAYRAALLVEAPEEQSKVKTYVGTVIWKLQNVSNGPGQPLATAVHADIDVPDDKLKISVDIQKNNDPSLSASHTITIVFNVAANSPTGGVKEISLPQLRNEDNPSGEPLRGIVVPIMDNSFLVGLSRGDAESANIELLKKLQWIDIPIMLDNGHIAKLTFEKNASGSRAIDDAVTSWQSQ